MFKGWILGHCPMQLDLGALPNAGLATRQLQCHRGWGKPPASLEVTGVRRLPSRLRRLPQRLPRLRRLRRLWRLWRLLVVVFRHLQMGLLKLLILSLVAS